MPEAKETNSEPVEGMKLVDLAKEGKLEPEWDLPAEAGLEDLVAAAYLERGAREKEAGSQSGCAEPVPPLLRVAEAELREARMGRAPALAVQQQLRALYLADCRVGVQAAKSRWQEILRTQGQFLRDLGPGGLRKLDAWTPKWHFEALEARVESDGGLAERDLERSERYRFALTLPHDENCHTFDVVAGIIVFGPESVLLLEHGWRRKISEGQFGAVVRVYQDGVLEVSVHPAVLAEAPAARRVESVKGLASLGKRLEGFLGGQAEVARGGLADGARGWWSIRVQGIADKSRDEVEGAVRVVFEGALFERGAVWVQGSENGVASGELWSREILEEVYPDKRGSEWTVKDIEESAEAAKISYGLSMHHCKLRPSLGRVLAPRAVDAIGRVLWAAIKPDTRHGTPPSLEKDHRQGDSGLISVWTRRGIAVATCTREAEKNLAKLQSVIQEMSAASSEAHKLAQELQQDRETQITSSRHAELRRLIRWYAGLRVKITDPDYRLLRSLFERMDHLQIHQVLLDIQLSYERASQTAAAQRLAEEQARQATAAQRASHRLHQLEIFIVAFYSFEFFRELAVAAHGAENHIMIFASAFVAALPIAALTWLHLSDEAYASVGEGSVESSRLRRALRAFERGIRNFYRPRKLWCWFVIIALLLATGLGFALARPHEAGIRGPLLKIVNTYLAPTIPARPLALPAEQGDQGREKPDSEKISPTATGKPASRKNPAKGRQRLTEPSEKGGSPDTGAKKAGQYRREF